MAALDVRATVRAILAEQFAVLEANVHDDSRLVEDFGADSLDLIEIVMEIEEVWGWELSPEKSEEMEHWSVRDLVLFIEQKLARQGH